MEELEITREVQELDPVGEEGLDEPAGPCGNDAGQDDPSLPGRQGHDEVAGGGLGNSVGVGAQRLLLPLRRRFPAAAPAVVLTLGVLALAGRLAPLAAPGSIPHAAHAPAVALPAAHGPATSPHAHTP